MMKIIDFLRPRQRAPEAVVYDLRGSLRLENGADAKTFLSDVYKKSTRAKKRRVDMSLYTLRGLLPQNAPDTAQPDDDVYTYGTRRGRVPVDGALSGRSMVEMLGVLAIIGVLSIGAISGYQKAMFKYRLNKQAEQINLLFNLMTKYKPQWRFTTSTVLVPYYVKLKEIPEDMVREDQPKRLYDVFQNPINMSNNHGPVFDEILLSIHLTQNAGNRYAVCQNIMQISKSYSPNLLYYTISRQTEQNPDSTYGNRLNGDKYCNKINCIKDMTMSDIEEHCRFCDNTTSCAFVFIWSLKD